MDWDFFCRVIDNHGDVGVCWRLAVALARRGQRVRLFIDDASALAWMAPAGEPGVQVLAWQAASDATIEPGAVVIEAFGCELPPDFVAAMAARAKRTAAPVWINLEYLSAEAYVERSHGLRSPQSSGPGKGLHKWFFYPGFSARTGGLLHADLATPPGQPAATEAAAEAAAAAAAANDTTDAADTRAAQTQRWLAARGWAAAPGERSVLLFGYHNPALPGLLQRLADRPTLLRLAPGAPQAALAKASLPAGMRSIALPHVSQTDFDRLLAASELNLVRGEDSFVRAQVASDAPMLWQVYPQHDGAHAAKLQAFADVYLHGAAPALASDVRSALLAFNGLAPWPAQLPAPQAWRDWHRRWRSSLCSRPDLADALLGFVDKHR